MWKKIKEAMKNKTAKNKLYFHIKNESSKITSNAVEICQEFNAHLISIGRELVVNIIRHGKNNETLQTTEERNSLSIFIYPVADCELIKYISTLKNTATNAHNSIINKIVKMYHSFLLTLIKYHNYLFLNRHFSEYI